MKNYQNAISIFDVQLWGFEISKAVGDVEFDNMTSIYPQPPRNRRIWTHPHLRHLDLDDREAPGSKTLITFPSLSI